MNDPTEILFFILKKDLHQHTTANQNLTKKRTECTRNLDRSRWEILRVRNNNLLLFFTLNSEKDLMAIGDGKHFVWKMASTMLIFCYLEFVLWFAVLRPEIYVDVTWVRKWFLSYVRKDICVIRMLQKPMAWFEVTFFSLLALFGYTRDSPATGTLNLEHSENPLADFENSMMGIHQKYYWMCIVPWIITFTHNWFENVFEYFIDYDKRKFYDAENFNSCMVTVIVYMLVQLLLASEVFYVALQGYCAMIKINDENMLWEKRKRSLDPDKLNTVFGVLQN
uniref:Uncharacterized protein n=1 Tax=Glossina austeni TaxID=7395 RepID=A0A1A9VFP8_GLOAU